MKYTRSARRTAVIAAGAATTALLLSSCSATTDAEPSGDGGGLTGELVITAYASIWEEQYRAAVIDPFLEANPGVSVTYNARRSSAEMLSALQAEGSAATSDVAIMDVSVGNTGNATGLFRTYDETEVPNLADVAPEFQNADGYGPVVMADAVGLLYDAQTFDEAPDSWEALWDDDYAGRVSVMAPPSGLGINLTAITADRIGEDFTQGIDETIAELQELAPNVQTWVPSPDEYQSVLTGQTVLGIGQNARGQFYADQSGGKLGVTIPEEGTVYQLNTINIREGSPNEEVALAFVDYALSAEAQEAFAAALFYAPTVTDAELPAEVADRVVQTDGSTNVIELDQAWLSTVREAWNERWQREVIG
ncbi:extracellular solute-binding protein [Arenivirga flava]|uniref:Polyamine ABC transporter substrate-binding protein n=1 Tax=Arenivirga flava TaxID=1930060 RepID=A0AA37UHU6_9MICO|nr:extracellular solute-binding protein [Arenivirga flava]GMA27215.1 polyamine ABC transporter substrate-binding protein [Arenivirga flava]